MKQQIFNYQLFLFGNKGEFITLTQVQGQQITMILTTDATRKFIAIGEDVINTSAIERIIRVPAIVKIIDYTKQSQEREEPEIRELTSEELKIQKMLDTAKNKIKLLN